MAKIRLRILIIASLVATTVAATQAPVAAASVAYAYDALGRITSATYDNGVVIAYSYDAAGNRTALVVSGTPTPPSGSIWGSFIWGMANW